MEIFDIIVGIAGILSAIIAVIALVISCHASSEVKKMKIGDNTVGNVKGKKIEINQGSNNGK
jgi:hypothetical protein